VKPRPDHTTKFLVRWSGAIADKEVKARGQPSQPLRGKPHVSPAERAALPEPKRPDHTGPNLKRPVGSQITDAA
jgi:hypothetical protein